MDAESLTIQDDLECGTFANLLLREKHSARQPDPALLPKVNVISQLFPQIRSMETIEVMTAWLYYNCRIDDIVEKMSGEQARYTLLQALNVFQEDYRLENRELEDSSATVNSGLVDDIIQLSENLLRQLRSILAPPLLSSIFPEIHEVLTGLILETNFRETRSQNVNDYLSIRIKTFGLSPWYIMLGIPSVAVPMSHQEVLMDNLKNFVNISVALQNDIIGLERDIQSGERMNYAIIHHHQQQQLYENTLQSLTEGVRSAKEVHDYASRQALIQYKQLLQIGSSSEKFQAEFVYSLISTHFRWAFESERYKKTKVKQNGPYTGDKL